MLLLHGQRLIPLPYGSTGQWPYNGHHARTLHASGQTSTSLITSAQSQCPCAGNSMLPPKRVLQGRGCCGINALGTTDPVVVLAFQSLL